VKRRTRRKKRVNKVKRGRKGRRLLLIQKMKPNLENLRSQYQLLIKPWLTSWVVPPEYPPSNKSIQVNILKCNLQLIKRMIPRVSLSIGMRP
jgi:hypothetical protein